MKRVDYDIRETAPFEPSQTFGSPSALQQSPVVDRLQSMWETFRDPVVRIFQEVPGLPEDPEAYLAFVDDIYPNDAYHSLSIEGYRVTFELIDRVPTGDWDPDANSADRQSHDAMAARGYWQAFRLVRQDVGEIIAGANPGPLIDPRHRGWYRELFQPGVEAGIIEPTLLAGYRNHAVFLRGSHHVPPRHEAVRDAMPALSTCSRKSPNRRCAPFSGSRPLAVRLYPSLCRRQWTYGPLPHERHARVRWVSLDRDTRGPARGLSFGSRAGERTPGRGTVRPLRGASGGVVDAMAPVQSPIFE